MLPACQMTVGDAAMWRLLVVVTSCLTGGTSGQIQRFTVSPPDSVNVTQGSDTVLPCKVENRVGLVQWVKDGLTLGYNRNITGYPRYLVVGEETEGEYNLQISSVM